MAWGNSVMLWFLNLENTARKIKGTFSKESISEFMALLSVLDHFNMFSMYAETSLRLSSLSSILFLLDSFYWFTDQNLFAYAGTTCNSILFSLCRSGRSAILSLNFLVRITMILLASNYRNVIMDMEFYIRENYGVCSVNGHGYEKYPTVIDVRWLP